MAGDLIRNCAELREQHAVAAQDRQRPDLNPIGKCMAPRDEVRVNDPALRRITMKIAQDESDFHGNPSGLPSNVQHPGWPPQDWDPEAD